MVMTSPLLPCSLIPSSSISPHRHRHRPFLFRKTSPSHYSAPRFYVSSCSSHNQKESGPGPKFDRRDMLLSMGALYSAANSPALAAPIPAVTIDECGTAIQTSDAAPIDFNCCPPDPLKVVPQKYVIPNNATTRIRPALQTIDANPDQLKQFEKAIQAMKDLSKTHPGDPRGFDQQSHVHCAYCNFAYPQSPDSDIHLQIHWNWLFFPFHRWYLYFYERIAGKLIGDDTFALPFWNWDNPQGMYVPTFFQNEKSSLYNAKRNFDHYTQAPNLQYHNKLAPPPRDTVIQNNLTEMYQEVIGTVTPEDFYGGKYSVGSPQNFKMQGSVEKGSHNALHLWVGQNCPPYYYDMGNFATAGNDMLFFCHHSNIDRLWNVWRDVQVSRHLPPLFEDDDWLNTEFVFYDENADPVIVTVRDSFDNSKMGYTWEPVDNPWMRKKPKAYLKKSTFAKTTKEPKVTDTAFPVKLDKVLRVLVNRPKKKISAKKKDNEIELLVIEDIEVESSQFVRFEVFVNDEDLKPEELISTAEYAGCFSQIPITTKDGKIKSKMRLSLDELLEELDIEDDDKILVSVVPKSGGEYITIGGIKIVYA